LEKLGPVQDYAGSCNDISEMVTNRGPGMQMPYPGIATDFYYEYPFPRKNEDDDALFYGTPRLVNHLDHKAIDQVKSIYTRLLQEGSKILDLMSSWVSYLPGTLGDYESIGLGLNEEELKANRQLSGFVLHDLNRRPELPFEENDFDAVICTASIEYLVRPIQVITEVARVTKPGGVFISTFSDRWFPGKEILPWPDMHPFERLGLVLDYYLKTDAFENLHTESIRGLPRPPDDIHIKETVISDPVFAVWGNVKA
jgi:SAM-dependent methyltransferase